MKALNKTAAAVLAACPTGHEMPLFAAGIAERLPALSLAQVAAALGRLRSAGLTEREDSTWARFDSAAPGLDSDQAAALAAAESARPSPAQAQRLENFGPLGLSPVADLAADLVAALAGRNVPALARAAFAAEKEGLHHRAYNLYHAAGLYCADRVQRARLGYAAQAAQAAAETADQAAAERASLGRIKAAERAAVAGMAARVDRETCEAVNRAPAALNGCPVLAVFPRRDGCAVVLVKRPESFRPFVVASYWPDLGDSWSWGNYLASAQEAESVLAEMLPAAFPNFAADLAA